MAERHEMLVSTVAVGGDLKDFCAALCFEAQLDWKGVLLGLDILRTEGQREGMMGEIFRHYSTERGGYGGITGM